MVFEVEDVLERIGHAVGPEKAQLGGRIKLVALRPPAIKRVSLAQHSIAKGMLCRNHFRLRLKLLHIARQLLVTGMVAKPRDFIGKKNWCHTGTRRFSAAAASWCSRLSSAKAPALFRRVRYPSMASSRRRTGANSNPFFTAHRSIHRNESSPPCNSMKMNVSSGKRAHS